MVLASTLLLGACGSSNEAKNAQATASQALSTAQAAQQTADRAAADAAAASAKADRMYRQNLKK